MTAICYGNVHSNLSLNCMLSWSQNNKYVWVQKIVRHQGYKTTLSFSPTGGISPYMTLALVSYVSMIMSKAYNG